MAAMKTPGVHVVDKNAVPDAVVEVATAVPAFIGYTEKADSKGQSLAGKPWRIASLAEYQAYFGGAPFPTFRIDDKPSSDEPRSPGGAFRFQGKSYRLMRTGSGHLLYYSLLLFFQNGGGACYIVSVGSYDASIEAGALTDGIGRLLEEKEPTMVVIPDAVRLECDDCTSVQRAALEHCGQMRNRFAILDVWRGYADRHDPAGDPVAAFRGALVSNHLDLAAAYYPWVNTTIVQDGSLSFQNIENADVLQQLIGVELTRQATGAADRARSEALAEMVAKITNRETDWTGARGKPLDPGLIASERALLEKSLVATSPLFNTILEEMKASVNLLPPSAAMAGVYTTVDSSRGVWKAPANVGLNGVISPAVSITQDEQEDLNVTTDGKSINAIRAFIGEGTLVWGARTLDGNSLDRRYVNVRRTMLMLEESIRLATTAYEREPNHANTWVAIKGRIRNFLTGLWVRGALAGSSADDAFSVHVGLGETMTAQDLLDGTLRVTVLVALVRPAEFIEVTFQLQMHSR
jgi:phage tail sheath protein FI